MGGLGEGGVGGGEGGEKWQQRFLVYILYREEGEDQHGGVEMLLYMGNVLS